MYEGILADDFLWAARKSKIDTAELYKCLKEILADPYNARGSHTLKHDFAGYRGADFDAKMRIVFRICEECRQKKQRELHPLKGCCDVETEPDKPLAVRFVDFGNYHRDARNPLRPNRGYDYPGDTAYVEIVGIVAEPE